MFSKIKDILKRTNERVIIVEDGEPRYVILTFEEYQQLLFYEKSGNIDKDIIRTANNSNVNAFGGEERFDYTDYGTKDLNRDFENEVFSDDESYDKQDNKGINIEDIPF